MISISLTSGITPRPPRRALPPSREAPPPAGTSSPASRYAFFPGDDFSKINPSFWLTCVVAFFGVPVKLFPIVIPRERPFLYFRLFSVQSHRDSLQHNDKKDRLGAYE